MLVGFFSVQYFELHFRQERSSLDLFYHFIIHFLHSQAQNRAAYYPTSQLAQLRPSPRWTAQGVRPQRKCLHARSSCCVLLSGIWLIDLPRNPFNRRLNLCALHRFSFCFLYILASSDISFLLVDFCKYCVLEWNYFSDYIYNCFGKATRPVKKLLHLFHSSFILFFCCIHVPHLVQCWLWFNL